MAERICPRCGAEGKRFYDGQAYCVDCHNTLQVQARRKPGRKEKVYAANNAWLRAHPEVAKRASAKWRALNREKNPLWTPPASHLLMKGLSSDLVIHASSFR